MMTSPGGDACEFALTLRTVIAGHGLNGILGLCIHSFYFPL